MTLLDRYKPERCIKCGGQLPMKWYGNLALQISQDLVTAEHHTEWFEELRRTGDDVARKLCWPCLIRAATMLIEWMEEPASRRD